MDYDEPVRNVQFSGKPIRNGRRRADPICRSKSCAQPRWDFLPHDITILRVPRERQLTGGDVHMGAGFWAAEVLVFALSSLQAPARSIAQPPPQGDAVIPATVALVETWPDGRTNYELTSSRRASMWTPGFPRVDGYKLPEGATPVYAVQFVRVLVGRDIKVDVSVLLGSAQQPGVPVASVVISPGSHVVIDGLAKFGVQPVTLSMVEAAPMTPYLPTVVSVSPQIEIANVELLNAPYPGYRITLRNLGSRGA